MILQPQPKAVVGRSPDRVWYRTEYGLWADRPWLPGERAEYIRTVLRREPYYGER